MQLQEQLLTPIPATDVPLFVTAGWFRLAADKYYVPISLAVPGSAVPPSNDKVTLDVAGFIRDERGFPVGRIRDTLTVPPASADGLAARQVLYQTGVTLPPGRFSREDRRPREHDRPDGNVRDADRRARAEARAGQGELARAQHAAAERGRRERR